MAEPKKCGNSTCTCVCADGKFCSQFCEDSAKTMTLSCSCPHTSCTGHLVTH